LTKNFQKHFHKNLAKNFQKHFHKNLTKHFHINLTKHFRKNLTQNFQKNFVGESVVATQHDKIVRLLVTSVGEIHMKTMPAAMFRLLTGQDQPLYL